MQFQITFMCSKQCMKTISFLENIWETFSLWGLCIALMYSFKTLLLNCSIRCQLLTLYAIHILPSKEFPRFCLWQQYDQLNHYFHQRPLRSQGHAIHFLPNEFRLTVINGVLLTQVLLLPFVILHVFPFVDNWLWLDGAAAILLL